jgi:GR25 family glycosyltransferase involved in LPS biosynthesis
MNEAKLSSWSGKLVYRLILGTRHLRPIPRCDALGSLSDEVVQRIYVINLDRQDGRWRQIRRELASVRDVDGRQLTDIARRFSAIDARYCVDQPDSELQHKYTLADQLFVDPQPLPDGGRDPSSVRIEMTPQEAAVARSHIAIWKLVAEGSPRYTLVLEDDVYFRRSLAKTFSRAWAELERDRVGAAFDLLYLSYEEARAGADNTPVSRELLKPSRGIWHLSGYVLSKEGAQRLLQLLPVCGPVDVWINHQFNRLQVFATRRRMIKQRLDCPSANVYSVLPILSKVGVLTREKPQEMSIKALAAPVFAYGERGTGLTALSTALSMLGYRCCSDVAALPPAELRALLEKQRTRVFHAYVNVGSLKPSGFVNLANIYPQARFIITTDDDHLRGPTRFESRRGAANDSEPTQGSDVCVSTAADLHGIEDRSRVLLLPADHQDKWQLLCRFLGCEYPTHRYPECADQGQRVLAGWRDKTPLLRLPKEVRLKWDSLPWIADVSDWHGMALEEPDSTGIGGERRLRLHDRFGSLDSGLWMLRDDTFPSNLALFSPRNFEVFDGGARLTLREEHTVVREYSSASLSSTQDYRYGRFVAELRPAKVSGLITGLFLHRNSPRQEIDIEFLGNDTTKLLLNVYYNPGNEGARLEYGYRGTPTLVDLGFDAAHDLHRYEIEWTPTAIQWRVDDKLVCQRVQWDPTPIPHLPMQFHLNLWHSRSSGLAGKLARTNLPAHVELKEIEVRA